MTPTYAAKTGVAPDRSRAEIERTLSRYGASQFYYGWDGDRAVVGIRALLPEKAGAHTQETQT